MIFPIDNTKNTSIQYIPTIRSKGYFIYLFLLVIIPGILLSLPFIYVDLFVKASGITRPISERTEVKSTMTGIIDSLYYKEGDLVKKGEIIIRIKDQVTRGKQKLNQFEIVQTNQFIHDLILLTKNEEISISLLSKLLTPLYREQASRYIYQKTDYEASLKKVDREMDIHTKLVNDKVISQKEFFDTQINQQKTRSAYQVFRQEQLSNWQQDLTKYRFELSQFQQQTEQIHTDASFYEIKAPVSGVIQGINTRYTGGIIQIGEVLCSISPEEMLIGECYVPTKDIGLLSIGQPARFQFEAYDYTYFGVLTGKITGIDNDFTIINNQPIFKVHVSFDATQLHLKSGFSGNLKKGLGFRAGFSIGKRSLWQLLYDQIDDWINPNSPKRG